MRSKLPLEQVGKAIILGGALALIYFIYCMLTLLPHDYHFNPSSSMSRALPPIDTRSWFLNISCDKNPSLDKKDAIRKFLSEDQIMLRTDDCHSYFETFPVLHQLQPQNQSNFPLAFSHLVHHEIGVLEAFLAIYFRPIDMHCIYIDRKATDQVRKAVNRLLKCYREQFYESDEQGQRHMFVHFESEVIEWGDSSILKADLACLRQLLVNDKASTAQWQYFFNLAGSELPLKTEEWTRKMLRRLEGKSLVEGLELPEGNRFRIETPHYLKW